MLVGTIMKIREEVLKDPNRHKEAVLKVGEVLQQLPSDVTIKARYVFGGGDNVNAILVLDVQSCEQLMPLAAIYEYFNYETYPVVDNMGGVVQQAVR